MCGGLQADEVSAWAAEDHFLSRSQIVNPATVFPSATRVTSCESAPSARGALASGAPSVSPARGVARHERGSDERCCL